MSDAPSGSPSPPPEPTPGVPAGYATRTKSGRAARPKDAQAPGADDARRTWYADIEVDSGRRRVYVLARRTQELRAFTYDGQPAGRVQAPPFHEHGGIAVLPDGRVAAGGDQVVQLYDPALRPVRRLDPGPGSGGRPQRAPRSPVRQ